LIDPSDPWWVSWLSAHGLPVEALKSQVALAMSSQVIDASAAIAGFGVALLTPAYYRQELIDGRLIQPFDEVMKEDSAYWLAYPEGRRNVPKIKAFRDWIVAEAAKGP
jgi:LysR family glycine cleavage system transcriptional activator